MSGQRVEATAPCFVDLAGGEAPVARPVAGRDPGPVAVSVAIDRRAWCRIETDVDGVQIASKDTLEKATAASVAELLDREGPSLIAHVLSVLGFERGVSVVTQRRVPAEAGLGAASAEAVAVAAAAATAAGRPVDPEGLWRTLREAESRSWAAPDASRDYQPALRGGVIAVRVEAGAPRAVPLPVDPARVEESLLLVDGGAGSEGPEWRSPEGRAGQDESTSEARALLASLGRRVEEALGAGRFGEVVDLLNEDWEARARLWPDATTPEAGRIAEVARAAGGAARVCGGGRGRVVALWAPPGDRGPGRREAVERALGAAGYRVFPARVDLRGLEVE